MLVEVLNGYRKSQKNVIILPTSETIREGDFVTLCDGEIVPALGSIGHSVLETMRDYGPNCYCYRMCQNDEDDLIDAIKQHYRQHNI